MVPMRFSLSSMRRPKRDPKSSGRPNTYPVFVASDVYASLDRRLKDWINARAQSHGFDRDDALFLSPGHLAELVLMHPCNDFNAWVYPIQDGYIQMLGDIAGADIVGLEPADAMTIYLNEPRNRDTALAIIQVYAAYLAPYETGDDPTLRPYFDGRIGDMIHEEFAFLADMFGQEKAADLLAKTDGYLVDARNRTFFDTARPYLERGGALVAVGAFHLPRETGLVEMLRAAGFTVERVPVAGEIGYVTD